MASNRYLNPDQFREFNTNPHDETNDIAHRENFFVVEGPVHKNYLHPDNAHWTSEHVASMTGRNMN